MLLFWSCTLDSEPVLFSRPFFQVPWGTMSGSPLAQRCPLRCRQKPSLGGGEQGGSGMAGVASGVDTSVM